MDSNNVRRDDQKDISPRVRAVFQQLDKNGDGLLDCQELGSVLRRLSGDDAGLDEESIRAMFQAADMNHDGKVDLNEFLNWVFHDHKGKHLLQAVDRERMQKMGTLLMATDVTWMKEHVDNKCFTRAVLSLTKPNASQDIHSRIGLDGASGNPNTFAGTVFDADPSVDTLAAAHALLSVEEFRVPSQAWIQPSQRRVGDSIVQEPLSDVHAAPLLYAALVAGIRRIKVLNVQWGERMTEAIEHGLNSSPLTEVLDFSSGYISEEGLVVRIFNAIEEDTLLHTINLSNNLVGAAGLAAISEAVKSCASVRNLYLYNIGPWTEGVGLGCQRDGQAFDTLLELRKLVKDRGGTIHNEAFHSGAVLDSEIQDDGDVEDQRVIGAGCIVHDISRGARVPTHSHPEVSSELCSGWLIDGDPVVALKENMDGQWVRVRSCAPPFVKGWIRARNFRRN